MRFAASLAALAAVASTIPLQAQEPLSAPVRESLQCAIWASYFSVEFQDQPEGAAFAYAFNYFVGRYEGLTGRGIDQVLDEDLVKTTAEALDALTPVCAERMEAYGTRMVEWGQVLKAIGERMPADEGLGPNS
jgi:hypothetical protein